MSFFFNKEAKDEKNEIQKLRTALMEKEQLLAQYYSSCQQLWSKTSNLEGQFQLQTQQIHSLEQEKLSLQQEKFSLEQQVKNIGSQVIRKFVFTSQIPSNNSVPPNYTPSLQSNGVLINEIQHKQISQSTPLYLIVLEWKYEYKILSAIKDRFFSASGNSTVSITPQTPKGYEYSVKLDGVSVSAPQLHSLTYQQSCIYFTIVAKEFGMHSVNIYSATSPQESHQWNSVCFSISKNPVDINRTTIIVKGLEKQPIHLQTEISVSIQTFDKNGSTNTSNGDKQQFVLVITNYTEDSTMQFPFENKMNGEYSIKVKMSDCCFRKNGWTVVTVQEMTTNWTYERDELKFNYSNDAISTKSKSEITESIPSAIPFQDAMDLLKEVLCIFSDLQKRISRTTTTLPKPKTEYKKIWEYVTESGFQDVDQVQQVCNSLLHEMTQLKTTNTELKNSMDRLVRENKALEKQVNQSKQELEKNNRVEASKSLYTTSSVAKEKNEKPSSSVNTLTLSLQNSILSREEQKKEMIEIVVAGFFDESLPFSLSKVLEQQFRVSVQSILFDPLKHDENLRKLTAYKPQHKCILLFCHIVNLSPMFKDYRTNIIDPIPSRIFDFIFQIALVRESKMKNYIYWPDVEEQRLRTGMTIQLITSQNHNYSIDPELLQNEENKTKQKYQLTWIKDCIEQLLDE